MSPPTILSPDESAPFQRFRELSCILLGGLVGALIGTPVAAAVQPPASPLILIAALALGVAVGYRRRRSPGFFYFALLAVCILAGLLAMSGISTSPQAP